MGYYGNYFGSSSSDSGGSSSEGAISYVRGPLTFTLDRGVSDGVLDTFISDAFAIEADLMDELGQKVSITGCEVTARLSSLGGAQVGSDLSGSIQLGSRGIVRFTIPTEWTAAAGEYRMTITRTEGDDVQSFGPYAVRVRRR